MVLEWARGVHFQVQFIDTSGEVSNVKQAWKCDPTGCANAIWEYMTVPPSPPRYQTQPC